MRPQWNCALATPYVPTLFTQTLPLTRAVIHRQSFFWRRILRCAFLTSNFHMTTSGLLSWMPRGGCSCRGWPLWGGFSTDSPNVFFTWRGYVPGFTTTASLLAGEHNAHNDMHGKWSSLRTPTDHSE